jgi:inorganic pyrophosphatase
METVDVVVEIPRGSRNKYEWDEQVQAMRFDRRLLGALAFPADYGFVPGTQAIDGDPLDALVLLDEPSYPGVHVTSRVIGVQWLKTPDGDEPKLLCVPDGEPAYEHVQDLEDLPSHLRDEIGHFFAVYQQLDEHGGSTSEGQEGRAVALQVLQEAQDRWREAQSD